MYDRCRPDLPLGSVATGNDIGQDERTGFDRVLFVPFTGRPESSRSTPVRGTRQATQRRRVSAGTAAIMRR